MKKLFAVFMIMAVVAVFAGTAFAAPEYTIKVGYIGSDSHPTMKAMKEVTGGFLQSSIAFRNKAI